MNNTIHMDVIPSPTNTSHLYRRGPYKHELQLDSALPDDAYVLLFNTLERLAEREKCQEIVVRHELNEETFSTSVRSLEAAAKWIVDMFYTPCTCAAKHTFLPYHHFWYCDKEKMKAKIKSAS